MRGARRAVVAPPLRRLVAVEVRKSLDTRAGRWFAGSILGVAALGVLVVGVAAPAGSVTLGRLLGVVGGALGYFLPVLVILMVTSEWSQRTALVTFTLEPRRGRVTAAKLLASLVLAVVALVVSAVLSLVAMALAAQRGVADWGLGLAEVLGPFVLGTLLSVLLGFALATLLLHSAAAIVAYLVLTLVVPGVVAALSVLYDGFAAVAPWIDLATAQVPLATGDHVPTAIEVARLLVTITLWVVLPLIAGVLRLQRAEVR